MQILGSLRVSRGDVCCEFAIFLAFFTQKSFQVNFYTEFETHYISAVEFGWTNMWFSCPEFILLFLKKSTISITWYFMKKHEKNTDVQKRSLDNLWANETGTITLLYRIPYRLDIYELLNRTSGQIVRVAAASGVSQEFRIVQLSLIIPG